MVSLALFYCVDKYIPFNVSVRARTSAGYGPTISNITFTEEGSELPHTYTSITKLDTSTIFFTAPMTAPDRIMVRRSNATYLNISWEKMSLEEARGFVTGYTIRYDSIERRRRRAVTVEAVDPDSFHKVIGGLQLTESYSITVSASTSAGEGVESAPVILEGELRMSGLSGILSMGLAYL